MLLYTTISAFFAVTITICYLRCRPCRLSDQPSSTASSSSRQSIHEWRRQLNEGAISSRNQICSFIVNLLLLWCSYLAIAATVLTTFSCDFVKSSDPDGLHFGVWSYRDSSDDHDCRSYGTDGGPSIQDFTHFASCGFSVSAILTGGIVVISTLDAFCRGQYSDSLKSIVAYGSLLAGIWTGGIFVLAAENGSELSRGSIFGLVALSLWLVLQIGIYLLDRFSDSRSISATGRPRPTNQQNGTRTTAGRRNNEENRTRPSTRAQNEVTRTGRQDKKETNIPQPTLHSGNEATPTVKPPKDKKETYQNPSTDDPNVRVWKDEQGRWKQSRRVEYRDTEGTKVVETQIETLKCLGSPMMSISEDDMGRLVKITVTEYVDRVGEVLRDKTEEILETSSQGDEEDQNSNHEETKHEIGEAGEIMETSSQRDEENQDLSNEETKTEVENE